MPVKNAQGRVIGVSQLVNKQDGTSFNKNDENFFEVSSKWFPLLIFCAIDFRLRLIYHISMQYRHERYAKYF